MHFVFGDFNYTSIDWTAIQLATSNSETAEFLDFCLDHNLTQLINELTRVAQDSANTLDLVLTTHTEYSSFITYLHATFSFKPSLRQSHIKKFLFYEKGYSALNDELLEFYQTYKVC